MRLAADSRTRRSSADSLLIGGTKQRASASRQTARDSQDVTTTAAETLSSCVDVPLGAARYRALAGRENRDATALVARVAGPQLRGFADWSGAVQSIVVGT